VDQLIFLDELAANERTGDRRYGWSPIGTTCRVARLLWWGEMAPPLKGSPDLGNSSPVPKSIDVRS
jgi:hypothetical protein